MQQAPAIDGVLDDDAWRDGRSRRASGCRTTRCTAATFRSRRRSGSRTIELPLLRVSVRRSRAGSDQDVDHPARQHLGRRLGGGRASTRSAPGRRSYHLMVNPSGIQLDMLNSVSGGRRHVAGLRLGQRRPPQRRRLRGRDAAAAVVDPVPGRRRRADGRPVLAPRQPRRRVGGVAGARAGPVGVREARLAVVRRVAAAPDARGDPGATFSSNQERATPSRWGMDGGGDLGLSAKDGITSTITLDATVNPDFSQVESDAFQVEVNQRFPVFFSEKRPFFMEGAGLFRLAGQGNDSSMLRGPHAAHRQSDPGVKVTGSAGRLQFGTLTAVDDVPRLPDGDGSAQGPSLQRRPRAVQPQRQQLLGGIVTEHGAGYNRVAGGDLSWRVDGNQRISDGALLVVARGRTGRPALGDRRTGTTARGASRSRASSSTTTATSGWTPRSTTGSASRAAGAMASGTSTRRGPLPWIRRITPFVYTQVGEDRIAGGSERRSAARRPHELHAPGLPPARRPRRPRGLGAKYSISGNADPGPGAAVPVDAPQRPHQLGHGRVLRSDRPVPGCDQCDAHRDDVAADAGCRSRSPTTAWTSTRVERRARLRAGPDLQPDDLPVLTQFFIRGIVQYDSSRSRVLTDLLSSYELRPGTVVYAGYGSLIERRDFVDDAWVRGGGSTRRVTAASSSRRRTCIGSS